jgi:hypothetical protein
MGTEINKNKIWTSSDQTKRRRKKVEEPIKKSAMNTIVNQFIVALKTKHM